MPEVQCPYCHQIWERVLERREPGYWGDYDGIINRQLDAILRARERDEHYSMGCPDCHNAWSALHTAFKNGQIDIKQIVEDLGIEVPEVFFSDSLP